jgi:hypothetical protein
VKVKVAEVLEVAASGLPVICVSGTPFGGAPVPNCSTSCGRLVTSSRLWNCCSASWFSFASRTRKPLFGLVYIACTIPATFQSRYPVPEAVVTAAPVVAGWFAHVTPLSVQEPPSWKTWSVRPPAADFA